ncbi:MAG: 50S ribosome-binding GTPase, partial [Armatimonadetes bacterium]|nr:50S ribosome-binding GTPase [Armatimonadota bacterium]
MKIAILGLPLSGKTTLFRALAAGHYSDAGEAHLAAVAVPDRRLDVIAEREHPRKKTYASVTFVDVGAMRAGEDAGARLDKLHALTGDADALLLVVQAFGDIDHAGRPLDVSRDLRDLLAEVLLTDMAIVERRLDRV